MGRRICEFWSWGWSKDYGMIKTFLIEKKYDDDEDVISQYICCDHTEIRKVVEFVAGVNSNMVFMVTELTETTLIPSKRKDAIYFELNANDYSATSHIADMITSLFNNKISGTGVFELPQHPEETDEHSK